MLGRAQGKIAFLCVVITLVFFAAVTKDAGSSSNLIYIKNGSSSSAMLQINDDVCKQSNDIVCDNARTLLLSQECLQDPLSPSCKAARDTVDSKCGCVQARNTLSRLDCKKNPSSRECSEAQSKMASSSCQEGLIFEGIVESGVKIPLTICLSPSGYGNVSVKVIKNSFWKSYRLISPGDTLSYP
jgi:hypothetical protein